MVTSSYALALFKETSARREQSDNTVNPTSLRSHFLVTFYVERVPDHGGQGTSCGKFVLSDLAGSKRLGKMSGGNLMKKIMEEGIYIN